MEIRYEHRVDMAKHLPKTVKIILDVGCNTGRLGEYLKTLGVEKVVGIDVTPHAVEVSKEYEDEVHLIDVEVDNLPYPEEYFDAIFFGDVIEHLKKPWETLKRYQKYLKKDGIVIASIPNISHFSVLGKILRGNFFYEDAGILDRTHLRFFTKDSAIRIFEDCGYEVINVEANKDYINGRALDNREIIQSAAHAFLQSMAFDANKISIPEGLFAIQYVLVAKKK